jgi:hypothetical protein
VSGTVKSSKICFGAWELDRKVIHCHITRILSESSVGVGNGLIEAFGDSKEYTPDFFLIRSPERSSVIGESGTTNNSLGLSSHNPTITP